MDVVYADSTVAKLCTVRRVYLLGTMSYGQTLYEGVV